MRLFFKCYIIAVVGMCVAAGCCLAQEDARPKSFQGIEVLSGWGQANLKSKADYNFTPILLDFDFKLNRFLQFQIEPTLSIVYQPDQNVEAGNSFLLKAGLLSETHNLRPYIKGGVGLLFMSQHVSEQSTQFNFTEHIGVGSHYFFSRDSSFIIEVRFRHTSNGGLRKPNNGIDSYLTLCGLSYKF